MNGEHRVKISDLTKWFAENVPVYLCILGPDIDRLIEQKGMLPLSPEELAHLCNQLLGLDWQGTVSRVLDEFKERREKDHLNLL